MIVINSIRIADPIPELILSLREKIESRINLIDSSKSSHSTISQNMLLRACFITGLSLSEKRNILEIEGFKLLSSGTSIHDTVFVKGDLSHLWSAILKLRYQELEIDLHNSTTLRKVVLYEIKRGAEFLLQEENLDEWLLNSTNQMRSGAFGSIPRLSLNIGHYEDEIDAKLDLNSVNISNTQILVAGTTGSGKSNLLAVLINEIRSLSIDTSYPVNFLLFDYKGEFSDPANNDWLNLFEVDRGCILDPIKQPLPFNPFKDFTGRTQNEINLYSTELANALCSIDNARISANMSNRLSEAIINSYKQSNSKSITFDQILKEYTKLQNENDRDKDDSIKSVLKQLIRNNLFSKEDSVNLIKETEYHLRKTS
jgi:hypothetical protein